VILEGPLVAVPGFIDAHTHICFGGSRVEDYALRVSGTSYRQIAARGGGILDTVRKTRKTADRDLIKEMLARLKRERRQGITTCEVKSGYGLTVEEELRILRIIRKAGELQEVDVIPTCLAAHAVPKEYASSKEYLNDLTSKLLPNVKKEKLAERIDIFIEEGAFLPEESLKYLEDAQKLGFSLTVHANQFSTGGAAVAAQVKAKSADHLEIISRDECRMLRESQVIAVVLPGASLGLGLPFAPARMMLDEGLSVAIASDWNPGSAPMGQLLMQAAVLGAKEKMTIAETLAGITCRAAWALGIFDRGILSKGFKGDFASFPCRDYREILYHQGSLLPAHVHIKGKGIQYTSFGGV
jgi:imidazolonepropionase